MLDLNIRPLFNEHLSSKSGNLNGQLKFIQG